MAIPFFLFTTGDGTVPIPIDIVTGGGGGVRIFAQNFSRRRWKALLAERKKERETIERKAAELQDDEDVAVLMLLAGDSEWSGDARAPATIEIDQTGKAWSEMSEEEREDELAALMFLLGAS